MRSVWQRYGALATDGDTSSASSARVFRPSSYHPQAPGPGHLTSHPARRICVDALCGVYLRATLYRTGITTTAQAASRRWMATPASTTVSNFVGMIGTEVGLPVSVQTEARKCNGASPRSMSRRQVSDLFPLSSFCWHRSPRQGGCAAYPGGVHISPQRPMSRWPHRV